jgi:hypothetical protein
MWATAFAQRGPPRSSLRSIPDATTRQAPRFYRALTPVLRIVEDGRDHAFAPSTGARKLQQFYPRGRP